MTSTRVAKHGFKRWFDPIRSGARRAIGTPGGKPYVDAIDAIHAELAQTEAGLARITADVDRLVADLSASRSSSMEALDRVGSHVEQLRRRQSEFSGDVRACDVHISNLRQKVERDPQKPELVLTVRGVGYKYNPDAN